MGCRIENDVGVLGFASSFLGALIGGNLRMHLLAFTKGLCGGEAQESRCKQGVMNHID